MSTDNNRLIGFNNESLDNHSFLISYNKNDFWYTNPDITSVESNLPSIEQCKNNNVYDTQLWDETRCTNLKDYNQSCVRRELCLNRDYAEKLMNLQNNHIGSDQNYLDTKNKYSYEYIQSINLGVGIIGVVYSIYTFYKNRNIV